MKLLTHKFLLVIFYLLSTVISYSTEQPNFKNLIVYSEAKKLKNVEFKNNFNEIIKLNDYRGKLVNCDDLDVSTCESFVKSLMEKSGSRRITKQEEGEPILESNKSEIITGKLNINDLVGKVIEANVEVVYPRNRFMLPMRKIEL